MSVSRETSVTTILWSSCQSALLIVMFCLVSRSPNRSWTDVGTQTPVDMDATSLSEPIIRPIHHHSGGWQFIFSCTADNYRQAKEPDWKLDVVLSSKLVSPPPHQLLTDVWSQFTLLTLLSSIFRLPAPVYKVSSIFSSHSLIISIVKENRDAELNWSG